MAWQLILPCLFNEDREAAIYIAVANKIPLRTIKRWLEWWKKLSVNSFWKLFSHQLILSAIALPNNLFCQYQNLSPIDQLMRILRFLSQLRGHIP